MKKFISLLALLLIVCSFTACGDPKEEAKPFAGNLWQAKLIVGDDGYPALLEGDPMLIEVSYLDATAEGDALKQGAKSYYCDAAYDDGSENNSIEHNGKKYYYVGSSKSEDDTRFAVSEDNVTITVEGKEWLQLKRKSNTEFEVISCVKGVKSDIPVGAIFVAA